MFVHVAIQICVEGLRLSDKTSLAIKLSLTCPNLGLLIIPVKRIVKENRTYQSDQTVTVYGNNRNGERCEQFEMCIRDRFHLPLVPAITGQCA